MVDHKEFKNISRERLTGVRTSLAKQGIAIPNGDDVEVAGPLGVKLRAIYDEPKKTLRLEIIDKPIFIPKSQIWKVVDRGAAGLYDN